VLSKNGCRLLFCVLWFWVSSVQFWFRTRVVQIGLPAIILIPIAFPRLSAHWRILRRRCPYTWMLGIHMIQHGIPVYHI
jgi:hypothetical protein